MDIKEQMETALDNTNEDIISVLMSTLIQISLCSSNSMSSAAECGRLARKALEFSRKHYKPEIDIHGRQVLDRLEKYFNA